MCEWPPEGMTFISKETDILSTEILTDDQISQIHQSGLDALEKRLIPPECVDSPFPYIHSDKKPQWMEDNVSSH